MNFILNLDFYKNIKLKFKKQKFFSKIKNKVHQKWRLLNEHSYSFSSSSSSSAYYVIYMREISLSSYSLISLYQGNYTYIAI